MAKTWLEINGGFVHPFLHFDSENRRVIIHSPSSSRHGDTSDDSNSNSSATLSLEVGTTILKIPEICLLTLHSVERDANFGKSLFGVVHSLSNKDDDDGNNTIDSAGRNDVGSISNQCGGLYHDAQDVILALYLAYLREQLLLEKQEEDGCTQNNVQLGERNGASTTEPETELTPQPPTRTTTTMRPSSPWHFYEPYIDILPIPLLESANNDVTPSASSSSSSSFNNKKAHRPPPLLPRQWSITAIQNRLAGTSLCNRVLNEQNGIKTEYDLVKKAWMNKHSSTIPLLPNNFPTFENYDTMMAMVSSRGFANLGYDGVDALIPILDLLDHCRGGGHCDNVVQNNNNDNDEGEKVGWENGGSNHVSNHQGTDTEKVHSVLESPRVGPDVRYSRYYEDDSDYEQRERDETNGPLRKRLKTNMSYDDFIHERRGGVRVITSRSIPPGSILQMTYGAKGNATLLGRYGFCISNNVEPDGR